MTGARLLPGGPDPDLAEVDAVYRPLTALLEDYIDTARDYQKAYWKHGDPPLHPE